MQRPALSLIAAVSRNGVIGHDNTLLWRLPEDQRFFRDTTLGHPVIMGRKTWDSLPGRFRPLPGRANIVVTRNPAWRSEGALDAASLDDALALASQGAVRKIFVIGGAQLYAAALPRADELVLTEIDQDFEGSTRFPEWDRSAFEEVGRDTRRAGAPNDFGYAFVTYRRRR